MSGFTVISDFLTISSWVSVNSGEGGKMMFSGFVDLRHATVIGYETVRKKANTY